MKMLLGAVAVLVLMIGAQSVYAHSDAYKVGFAQGVRDGHHLTFHNQAKLADATPDEQNDFDLGYTAGFRSTCKEMGLTTGPDNGCEGSIDAGLP
jgi:hypothetical protein